jgi:hypothetical protein
MRVPLTTTGRSLTGAPPGGEVACANEESVPDRRIDGAIAAVASIEVNVFNDLASRACNVGMATSNGTRSTLFETTVGYGNSTR